MLSPRQMTNTFDTIIIGAGISGLACAAKLVESSSYNSEASINGGKPRKTLAVLEARDRIGGRIDSVWLNGNRLDTGANWIHGIGSRDGVHGVNPLVEILPKKQFRELDCNVSFKPPRSRQAVSSEGRLSGKPGASTDDEWVTVDGQSPSREDNGTCGNDLVVPSKITSELFHTLWTLIGSLNELSESTTPDEAKRTSILQAIRENENFRKSFETIPEDYHCILRALPQFIENMEAGPLSSGSALEARGHGGLGLLEYAIADFDGEQVFLQDGYTPLVKEVAREVVKQGCVKLNVEVEHINWDGDLIRVSTTDGTYAAKRLVCTLPLGVLQNDMLTPLHPRKPVLFSPDVPKDKMEAIRSLGFGTLDKVFLVYSRPWWTEAPWLEVLKKGFTYEPFPKDPDGRVVEKERNEPDSFWGFTDELPGIEIDAKGHVSQGTRALSLINLHALTGYPVLSCFVSCANAIHIEGLSNHAAGELVHRSLSAWLGSEPPAPDAVHVTRWAQDKYARGSYSHMVAGISETHHRADLGRPLINESGAELRFAGEHTSLNHFATVHGALLSGRREAEAILKSEREA